MWLEWVQQGVQAPPTQPLLCPPVSEPYKTAVDEACTLQIGLEVFHIQALEHVCKEGYTLCIVRYEVVIAPGVLVHQQAQSPYCV